MSTPNIGFYEDLTKNIFQLSSNTHLISSSECPFTHCDKGYTELPITDCYKVPKWQCTRTEPSFDTAFFQFTTGFYAEKETIFIRISRL